jgi:hypothetical protein
MAKLDSRGKEGECNNSTLFRVPMLISIPLQPYEQQAEDDKTRAAREKAAYEKSGGPAAHAATITAAAPASKKQK